MKKNLFKLMSAIMAFVFLAAMVTPAAASGGYLRPAAHLSVCYVVDGKDVTGAKFGYMAENIVGTPFTFQFMNPGSYQKPFAQPPVGANSDQIWSKVYPLGYHDIKWMVYIHDVGFKDVEIEHNIKLADAQKNLCPKSAPFVGYEIPYVILYTSAELQNGYGIIVSTEPFASVENIMLAFKLAAIPADLKQVCVGAVRQMNPDDMQGNWDCDPQLKGILPYGKDGGRLPLLGTPSLKNIWLVLTGQVPWVQP